MEPTTVDSGGVNSGIVRATSTRREKKYSEAQHRTDREQACFENENENRARRGSGLCDTSGSCGKTDG